MGELKHTEKNLHNGAANSRFFSDYLFVILHT